MFSEVLKIDANDDFSGAGESRAGYVVTAGVMHTTYNNTPTIARPQDTNGHMIWHSSPVWCTRASIDSSCDTLSSLGYLLYITCCYVTSWTSSSSGPAFIIRRSSGFVRGRGAVFLNCSARRNSWRSPQISSHRIFPQSVRMRHEIQIT
jgi:hypothetical protein